jgi:integrase
MTLTDVAIRKIRPEPKPIKVFDGHGLYLQVTPTGGKLWRMKYRFAKKEKLLSFGQYPTVSLKDARDRCFEARQKLANGIDPGAVHKAEQEAQKGAVSFEAVAREHIEKFSGTRTEGHSNRILTRMEKDVFPWIGSRSVAEIKSPDMVAILNRIMKRGVAETAHRAMQNCGQIFRYAIATGRAETNPVDALKGMLPRPKPVHFPTITEPKAVGELLRAIDGYGGFETTRAALRLNPLVFVRPGELRKAEWPEIDFAKREWRIPAHRMKTRVLHIVPLSTQALEILRELEPISNRPLEGRPDAPRYLFPSGYSRARCLSENGILTALRRLGYPKEKMTGHGFRSMASTLLHEKGWDHQVVERQLAHAQKNAVSAAYNHSEYLPQRREMMQDYADYLDSLKYGTSTSSKPKGKPKPR